MANEENSPEKTTDSTENKVHDEHKNVHHTHDAHHKHAEHAEHAEHEHKKSCGPCKCNVWMITSIILFVAAILFLTLWLTKGSSDVVKVSEDQIKTEMTAFIADNLVAEGSALTIDSVEDLNGVYKLGITVSGQQATSYVSKDGKLFFPYGWNISEVEAAASETTQETNTAAASTTMTKSDKPVVEVFVMAYCPYGTQIEKGLLPVVDLLGDKADIQVKFVSYAMHGQKEIDEQLNQYCVQQLYSDKYYDYLECFLAEGDIEGCVSKMSFNQDKLDACVAATDAEFGISTDYADKTTWMGSYPSFSIHAAENEAYGVQGSPTLVINGKAVSSARDSQSLKTIICSAFNDAPSECDTTLSSAAPTAGFGFDTTTATTTANCG